MVQSLQSLLEETIEVAERAGRVTLRYFRDRDLSVTHKSDGTQVSDADRDAEQLIRDHVMKHHRSDSILGEEFGLVEGTSGRRWIIDPIDGTFGFVRGVPLYATLIAIVDGESPLIGVIHLPVLERTLGAAVGEGCWMDQIRCTVGGRASVDGALVCSSDWNAASADQLLALHRGGAHMRTWGDAYGYAMVACGEAEAMVDPICSVWDLAPMPVIISEAGGRFTALDGSAGFDRGSGMATNGLVHDELLGLLNTQSSNRDDGQP